MGGERVGEGSYLYFLAAAGLSYVPFESRYSGWLRGTEVAALGRLIA